jgi:hypothetical protein
MMEYKYKIICGKNLIFCTERGEQGIYAYMRVQRREDHQLQATSRENPIPLM